MKRIIKIILLLITNIIVTFFVVSSLSSFKKESQTVISTPVNEEENKLVNENEHDKEEKKDNTQEEEIKIEFIDDKKYTIGVLPPVGIKVNISSTNEYMQFKLIQAVTTNQKRMFVSDGFYESLFYDEFILQSKEEYPFSYYTEDMMLSIMYHDMGKSHRVRDTCDFLFIPPVGMIITTRFADKLKQFLDSARMNFPNACAYQIYMSESDRIKTGVNHQLKGFTPSNPWNTYRTLGGLLFTPSTLYSFSQWNELFWFKSRFDIFIQHFCEVRDSEIVVSPKNLYNPTIDF